MGRKKSRTSVKSKSSMNSISKNIEKMLRADNKKDKMRRVLNQLDAWSKGKRVILNDDNGKRVEAKQIWGSPNKKFTIGRK
jgi:hypothetical protein